MTEENMLQLTQVTKDGTHKGNLVFKVLDDVEKWFFWAGLEIVARVRDSDTVRYEAVGKHGRLHSFLIRPVDTLDAAA
jgi:hypothetical protein